jgi:hypothetical protein
MLKVAVSSTNRRRLQLESGNISLQINVTDSGTGVAYSTDDLVVCVHLPSDACIVSQSTHRHARWLVLTMCLWTHDLNSVLVEMREQLYYLNCAHCQQHIK